VEISQPGSMPMNKTPERLSSEGTQLLLFVEEEEVVPLKNEIANLWKEFGTLVI
jgi:hypothetical protein